MPAAAPHALSVGRLMGLHALAEGDWVKDAPTSRSSG
jgi:hypothetical protein